MLVRLLKVMIILQLQLVQTSCAKTKQVRHKRKYYFLPLQDGSVGSRADGDKNMLLGTGSPRVGDSPCLSSSRAWERLRAIRRSWLCPRGLGSHSRLALGMTMVWGRASTPCSLVYVDSLGVITQCPQRPQGPLCPSRHQARAGPNHHPKRMGPLYPLYLPISMSHFRERE